MLSNVVVSPYFFCTFDRILHVSSLTFTERNQYSTLFTERQIIHRLHFNENPDQHTHK